MPELEVGTLFIFIMVGFFAQMINGSLGMSYGTLSVTFLLAMGTPPVVASSSVHIAKALTSGVSGFSHWRFGNVDRRLFVGLTVSGVIGGFVGANFLTSLPEDVLKPLIAVYLFYSGLTIIWHTRRPRNSPAAGGDVQILPLGAVGGFVDAVGGGGWGPIVTSTLLVRGYNPRLSIGSVSLAESFVATAVTATIFMNVSTLALDWEIVMGLISGGVFAAPFAAYLTGKLPVRALMTAVGGLVMVLSLGIFATAFRGLPV